MTKLLIVFGTRPEAIKMAPLVREFRKYPEFFETKVCVTAQHRAMLDQVLSFFEIIPDYDLNLMTPDQDLHSLTALVITSMKPVLKDFRPDYVMVQGDTTTTAATALASFYFGIKVCHVEAGLRTFNKRSPFPEEMNRQITSLIADYHFAPTVAAQSNLLQERIGQNAILVTGNTVVDAILWALDRVDKVSDPDIVSLKILTETEQKIILVTGHRRENFGSGFENICRALKEIAQTEDVQIIYPVHLNPTVQSMVYDRLAGIPNIHLMDPLSYPAFVWLMKRSYLIITDSGGIQEEAPSIGKPVLVMRETTERAEALESGHVMLVGTDPEKIIDSCKNLLHHAELYQRMSGTANPFGSGDACEKIVKFITDLTIHR
ncbi:MAG: UDP-N-acetylglucosamine 2-epimerase (non-hydrolyzing) [Porphyromonadaceae bacterium]|nr:MAG: UDP-N-acetylglucosamine 2-epimerase (non-hydrolyzing) [Porphyromonadaceae bacterium]